MKLTSKTLTLGLVLNLLCAGAALAFDPLPFPVKIGGQEAKKGSSEIIAVIDNPVAANAELEVPEATEMVIVNAFEAQEDGQPVDPTRPARVLMIQQGTKTTLDNVMGGQALEPGRWGMNVVTSGKTARVMFVIE